MTNITKHGGTNMTADAVLNYVPKWPLLIHSGAAMYCMLMSAIYHLFQVESVFVYYFLCQMDFGGIAFLIMGSGYPLVFYSMACEPVHGWRDFFLIAITIASLAVFAMFLHPKMLESNLRGVRVTVFISLGIAAAAPFIYLGNIKSMENFSTFSMTPFLIGGIFYVIGGVVMAKRAPEACC